MSIDLRRRIPLNPQRNAKPSTEMLIQELAQLLQFPKSLCVTLLLHGAHSRHLPSLRSIPKSYTRLEKVDDKEGNEVVLPATHNA